MVYCTWIEDVPDSLAGHPAAWRAHLDKFMEPKLSAEEQAESEAAEAAAAVERLEEEWASWGTSPEQLASQATLMGMFGAEG